MVKNILWYVNIYYSYKKILCTVKFFNNAKINLFRLKLLELNIYLRMEDNMFCTVFDVPSKKNSSLNFNLQTE